MKVRDIIQRKDPDTGMYFKMDLKTGEIISRKKTPDPYKGIPIVRYTKNSNKIWDKILSLKGTGQILDMNAVLK